MLLPPRLRLRPHPSGIILSKTLEQFLAGIGVGGIQTH